MFKQRGYNHFTKIDLSMMFYCFEVDEASKELCTIITLFRKSVSTLANGNQSFTGVCAVNDKKILGDLEINAYMDDVGIWTKGSFDNHMVVVKQVLERLARNGMKCNPLKCKWVVQEANFLGHHMTPTGVTHMRNKINVVLKMGQTTNNSEVQSFIGTVTFYKSVWPCCSHILAPLHESTGRGPFVWGPR